MKYKVFFPNLDGLRFLSFLAVFLNHCFYTDIVFLKDNAAYRFIKEGLFHSAEQGVDFFFVLSGFLITYLLLKENEITGAINVKNFYIRRILRIWPLFYFCVLFGFVAFPFFKSLFGLVPEGNPRLLPYLFFLNNLDLVKHGIPDASVLGVLWSIAVEEQFYIMWPLILSVAAPRKYVPVFAFFIALSLVFRGFNHANHLYLTHHTLAVISDMAVGGLAAFLAIGNKKFLAAIADLSRAKIASIYAAVFLLLFFKPVFFSLPVPIILERLITSVIFCLVILEQNFARASLFKMSRFKLMTRLGKYTYGLYCFHTIGILIMLALFGFLKSDMGSWQVVSVNIFASLAITVIMSLLSYRFLESQFLKLKYGFSSIVKE
jgi:peptidoglycan/LPS O-acetylase OafA/YrhL